MIGMHELTMKELEAVSGAGTVGSGIRTTASSGSSGPTGPVQPSDPAPVPTPKSASFDPVTVRF